MASRVNSRSFHAEDLFFVRRGYPAAVKNAIRRTDTLGLEGCARSEEPRKSVLDRENRGHFTEAIESERLGDQVAEVVELLHKTCTYKHLREPFPKLLQSPSRITPLRCPRV
jgi:hypothetical protein